MKLYGEVIHGSACLPLSMHGDSSREICAVAVKPVHPSYAPAAPGDEVVLNALAIHKLFLSFSSDKGYSCCPQEKMSA